MTGATGNVGTAVVRRLLADGHAVNGVARRPPDAEFSGSSAVTWTSADLATDCQELLGQAFRGCDAVVHLAWGFQPSHDLAYLERLGVGGTEQVLQAARGAGVAHVVHMSSFGAYAPRTGPAPVDESWPTTGVTSSPYSRHKVAAERCVDRFETATPDVRVARLRPGIIGQRSAGSALLRYGLPGLVPAAVLRALPLLPLDRRLELPVVHADDVADAVSRILDTAAVGAFNLAADPVITVEHLAAALGTVHVQVPAPVVRAAASLSWHARVQQVDPGWVDLAYQLPLVDTARAGSELGWRPATDAVTTLEEVVAGMRSSAADATPALRHRSITENVVRAWTRGPVSRRREP